MERLTGRNESERITITIYCFVQISRNPALYQIMTQIFFRLCSYQAARPATVNAFHGDKNTTRLKGGRKEEKAEAEKSYVVWSNGCTSRGEEFDGRKGYYFL
jgi:hypothetical protein